MNESVHDLAGAYALDALDDLERAAFERHLAECDSCTSEVEAMKQAVIAATAPVPPPPGLKARVMDDISRTSQTPAKRGGLPRWIPIAVAAVVAIVLAVGGLLGSTQRQIRQVLAAPDVISVPLQVTEAGSRQLEGVKVAFSPEIGRAVLVVERLEPVAADRAYEAWIIPPGADPIPGGVFVPSAEGPHQFLIDGEVNTGVVVAVTEEEAAGAPAPAGEVLVAGQV